MSLNPPFLCIYFARNRYHMPHAVLFLAGRGRVWSEISPREGCDLSPRRKQASIHFSLENGRLYNRGVKKRLSTAGPGKHESFQPHINPQRASLLSHTTQNLSFRISRVPPAFGAATACRAARTRPSLASFPRHVAQALCIVSIIRQVHQGILAFRGNT